MRRPIPLLALAGALLLFGCGGDVDDSFEETPKLFRADFDLTAGKLPTANNLLYGGGLAGGPADGTLHIPTSPTDPQRSVKEAISALDGFSTVAPVTTTFTYAIDPASLGPSSVQVFEVTLNTFGGAVPVGGPVSGVVAQLVYGQDYVASVSGGTTLVILPLRPLKLRSHYLVALTDGIRSTEGRAATPSDHYYILKTSTSSLAGTPFAALEPVRGLVQAQEGALSAFGVDTEPIVLSWTFSTQSGLEVLNTVRTVTQAAGPAESALFDSTTNSPGNAADVYVGTLDVPYYLTAASGPQDQAPLGTWWRAANPAYAGDTELNLSFLNPLPAATSVQTIPLMATIPIEIAGVLDKPATGWPVVIYQHGITSNRATVLTIADTLASIGFSAVAIDIPLHGLTGDPNLDGPFAGYYGMGGGDERTFDLDLDNDGVNDGSGTYMINLASLLTTRDNGRQAVADLFVLTKALEAMDYDGDGLGDFDTDRVYFVGHSLGGIVGGTFLALEPGVKSAVLGMSGGAIAKLLDGSATFGPIIGGGLFQQAGIERGTAAYESFMGAFQTAIDSADPINYAALTGVDRGVMLFEVLGDTVVPNNVPTDLSLPVDPTDFSVPVIGSPTAGTDPLAMNMGLTRFSATDPGTPGTAVDAWIRFTSGGHSSLLNPASDPIVTTVMQTAMATFLATDGATVTISDDSVVE